MIASFGMPALVVYSDPLMIATRTSAVKLHTSLLFWLHAHAGVPESGQKLASVLSYNRTGIQQNLTVDRKHTFYATPVVSQLVGTAVPVVEERSIPKYCEAASYSLSSFIRCCSDVVYVRFDLYQSNSDSLSNDSVQNLFLSALCGSVPMSSLGYCLKSNLSWFRLYCSGGTTCAARDKNANTSTTDPQAANETRRVSRGEESYGGGTSADLRR